MDTAGLPEDFPLPAPRYGFGISWDAAPGRPKVDLDLQCVVIDEGGAIIDCAYYNNLKAVRCITHSGDESTGEKDGIDELVWVNVAKLPPNVALLVFVIAAYSGGALRDVANGTFHVLQETKTNEIARFETERSNGAVDVVAAMWRGTQGQWTLRIIEEPAQQGQHFMDILPLISDVVRVFIPTAPRRQKVAFAMEKGAIMDLPQTMESITVGLGWDTDDGAVDLDVSAVMLDQAGVEVETVFFGNLESAHGVKHSGDNLTGEGEGDDEQIVATLPRIGDRVHQIIFVINIYTPGKTFQNVANPYCRVVDNSSGSELCRYSLREAGYESGLVVSKIHREAGGRWGFHALGLPSKGRTYKDSLPQIKQYCQMDTKKLMQRGGTITGFDTHYPDAPPPMQSVAAPHGAYAASPPPPRAATKECVVQ